MCFVRPTGGAAFRAPRHPCPAAVPPGHVRSGCPVLDATDGRNAFAEPSCNRTLRHLLFGNHNTYHNSAHKATVFANVSLTIAAQKIRFQTCSHVHPHRAAFFRRGECTALICQQLHAGAGGDVACALGQLRGILSALEVGGDQYDPGHSSSGSMRRWLRTALSKLTRPLVRFTSSTA